MPALSDRPASVLLSADADPVTAHGGADVFRVREPSSPHSRVRPKRHSARPTSYSQILEGFERETSAPDMDRQDSQQSNNSGAQIPLSSDNTDIDLGEEEDDYDLSAPSSVQTSPKRENTARRHKRFSMPAVALQTTPVNAKPRIVGEGRSKRYSLVLGGRTATVKRRPRHTAGGSSQEDRTLSRGVAAAKLQELLQAQEPR
jgi:hypothetical protein